MIIFDTEATGLLPSANAPLYAFPHIVEFAAIRVDQDLRILGAMDFAINPGIPLPKEFTEITGITEEDVTGLDSFAAHFNDVRDFFDGESTMVAHNVMYDEMVLEAELKRLGMERKFPWPLHHIDTVEATRYLEGARKGNSGRFNLAELHLHLTGVKLEKSHRAMDDVKALYRCVLVLRERNLI